MAATVPPLRLLVPRRNTNTSSNVPPTFSPSTNDEPSHLSHLKERQQDRTRRLAADSLRLSQLTQRLQNADQVTLKSCDLLNAFDERIEHLQKAIVPIQSGTQLLTRACEHMDETLDRLKTIVTHLDTADACEPIIAQKTPHFAQSEYAAAAASGATSPVDVQVYMKSALRVQEALSMLEKSRVRNCDKTETRLRILYEKAQSKMESLYRSTLALQSVPIDPTKTNLDQWPLSMEAQESIALLIQFFDSFSRYKPLPNSSTSAPRRSTAETISHVGIYADMRSHYLIKSLQGLSQATLQFDTKRGLYKRGAHPYLVYLKSMLIMLEKERQLCQKLLTSAPDTYQRLAVPVLKSLLATVDSFLAKLRSTNNTSATSASLSVSTKHAGPVATHYDLSDMLVILDIVAETESWMSQYETTISYQGKRMTEVVVVAAALVQTGMVALPGYLEEMQSAEKHASVIPQDATVHELTSNTMNFLKRLVDYQPMVERLLDKARSNAPVPSSPSPMGTYMRSILDVLTMHLEQRSRQYKRNLVGTVFLLNNYYHILKSLRVAQLDTWLPRDVERELERLLQLQRDAFLASWQPALDAMQENQSRSTLSTNMSQQERQVIKDRFRAVNSTFEDLLPLYKSLAMPDAEQKQTLIRVVRDKVVPLYRTFLDRYRQVPFTQNATKYFKFEVDALDVAIKGLFAV